MTYLSDLKACPECGAGWAYVHEGKEFSHLIGIYDQRLDRTVEWLCPECEARWPRGTRIDGPGSADARG